MITHWENFVFIVELKWLYCALTVLCQECSGRVEGLNKQCWDSLCLSQTGAGSSSLCRRGTGMQRVLNIPHSCSSAVCTQLSFTLNNDFWLKAGEPAQASSCSQARAPSSVHPWAAEASTGPAPLQRPCQCCPSHLRSSQHPRPHSCGWPSPDRHWGRKNKRGPFLAYEYLEELRGGWGAQPG